MDELAFANSRPRDVAPDSVSARHALQNTLPSLTDGFHYLPGKGG